MLPYLYTLICIRINPSPHFLSIFWSIILHVRGCFQSPFIYTSNKFESSCSICHSRSHQLALQPLFDRRFHLFRRQACDWITMAPSKAKSRATKSGARPRKPRTQTQLQLPTTSETIVTLDQSLDLLRIAVVAAVSVTFNLLLDQCWLTHL